MQYTRPSFSAAVSNGSISDTAYEVAVGLRCAKCQAVLTDGHVCSKWAFVTKDQITI